MAIKIEELQVLISANADQFKGELIKVNQQLKSLNDNTNKLTGSVGNNLFGSMVKANVIGGILTNTISKLGNYTKNLVGEIVENGSAFSRLKIATDTVTSNLGMTREQVRGLRDDLADANTYGTVAERVIQTLALSGMMDLAASLKAVDARTGEVREGISALVLTMKDLAAANNIDSSVGIERISKFIQRGETSFADGLIEIGEINREYKEFGDRVGKSTDMLSAQERAQVRLNIVMREGQKTFGAYANTYQTSGKAFASIRDITRSLKEQIGAQLEPILRVGSNAFLQFLQGIRASLFQTEGSVRGFAEKVAGYLVAVIRVIGIILSKIPVIGKNFAGLATFTIKPIQAQGKLGDAIENTGGAMDNLSDSTEELKKDLGDLASFDEMNVLTQDSGKGAGSGGGASLGGGSVVDPVDWASGFDESTDAINAWADTAMKQFTDIKDAIKDFLKPFREIKIFGQPIWKILLGIAAAVGVVIAAVLIGIKVFGILAGIFAFIPGVLIAVAVATSFLISPLGLLIVAFVAAFAASDDFRKGVIETGKQVIAKIKEMVAVFMEKVPKIIEALQPLTQAVGVFLKDAFARFGEIVTWVWNNVLKPFTDFILKNIVPAFSKAIDILIVVISTFSSFAAMIITTVSPILNSLWGIFKAVFKGIGDVVSFAWNSIIKPIFNGLYGFVNGLLIPVFVNLFNVGRWVFESLASIASLAWNGIKMAMQPVVNWINSNLVPVIQGLVNIFANVWDQIANGIWNTWDVIKGAVRWGINGFIDYINGFIYRFNGLIDSINNAISKAPGQLNLEQINFRVGDIPHLAKGGAVNSPTLAAMGEGGYSEAVLPLDRNTEWAQKIADLLRDAGGSGGKGNTILVQLGPEKIFERFIDYVNDKSVASNMTVLNV